MRQDACDHRRLFDDGDDLHIPVGSPRTAYTGFDIGDQMIPDRELFRRFERLSVKR